MRRFVLEFGDGREATIEIDQAVIDSVDDSWRAVLYQLYTPEEIAMHVGYNLVVNNIPLSLMDGWADKPNSMARIVQNHPGLDVLSAREITDE